jgi:hypothetical protein
VSLLRFDRFAGANLALHPLLIPPGVGVECVNVRPGRGDLRPWNSPATVATVPGGTTTIYRMGRAAGTDASYWLAWAADVDVARGMVPGDTAERTFWTGEGPPKWTDNSIGLAAAPYPTSTGVRLLGVPVPNAAPTLSVLSSGPMEEEVDGETQAIDPEDRAYVVTWVNDRGEESSPSDAATITLQPGSLVRVSRNATVPSGALGITSWRVYRTVAGAEGDYFFVTEALAATAHVDVGDAFNPFSTLLSLDWDYPPAGLRGIKALWNGMHAGFVGNDLYFSEAFRPFAWPEDYRLPLDDQIVALARWRTNLIALTTGRPYVVTGSSPSAMRAEPLEIQQPCVAKRGVAELGHGVVWPSRDGLVYLGDGGWRMLTARRALQEDWLGLQPHTLVAGVFEGLYVASYDPGAGAPRRSIIVDPMMQPDSPAGLHFCDVGFTACHSDESMDALYVLAGTNVQKWHAGAWMRCHFVSRTERLTKPEAMGWAQVVASQYPAALSVWSDGALVLDAATVSSGKAFRLPRGNRGTEWRVRVSTEGDVQGVALAGSLHELKQVP